MPRCNAVPNLAENAPPMAPLMDMSGGTRTIKPGKIRKISSTVPNRNPTAILPRAESKRTTMVSRITPIASVKLRVLVSVAPLGYHLRLHLFFCSKLTFKLKVNQ